MSPFAISRGKPLLEAKRNCVFRMAAHVNIPPKLNVHSDIT